MARELCVLQANCQGEALKQLLESHEEFTRFFEIRYYLNYARQEIPGEELSCCRLFLHQYLHPKWEDLATDELLKLLSPRAEALCLPNFFFKGYWPTWTGKLDCIEFADSLLEELLGRGLKHEQILALYLRGGAIFGDVEEIAAQSLALEREKEARTPFKYVDYMESHWRDEQLFLTINHPSRVLFINLANQILSYLNLSPLPREIINTFEHPQNDFWLPIHPWVGKKLNLPFASGDRLYPCFASRMTHSQYTAVYLGCRKYNIANLTGVLMGLEKFPGVNDM